MSLAVHLDMLTPTSLLGIEHVSYPSSVETLRVGCVQLVAMSRGYDISTLFDRKL